MTYNTYQEYSESINSEKITLVFADASERILNLRPDVETGLIFDDVRNIVVAVENLTTGIKYTSVANKNLVNTQNKYFFDLDSNKLFLFPFDYLTDELLVTYRFFWSNSPINLPYNLSDTGKVVPFEPRVSTTPEFQSNYSQGKQGISLVGSGNLKLSNQDSYFNDIFDRLIWENRNVNVFSFHRDLSPSEAKLIFRGYISGKSFDRGDITFNVTDDIFSFKERIPLESYANEDVRDEDKARFKRWVYGKADNLLCQSINQIKEGYEIKGSLSAGFGDTGVRGNNTFFLSDLSPGDTIVIDSDPNNNITVDEVISDTYFTCNKLSKNLNTLSPIIVQPDIPYYNKNREFFVTGHALKQLEVNITQVYSKNRMQVSSTATLQADDFVTVNGFERQIRRITSNNEIVLKTNLGALPVVGNKMIKIPVRNLRYKHPDSKKEIFIQPSEYSFTNTSSGVKLTISEECEFNSTKIETLKSMCTFINGRNKIWMGAPTFINITTVGGTGPSFFTKYFVLFTEDGKKLCLWFTNNLNEDELGATPMPSAVTTIQNESGSRVRRVPLENKTYTANEMAEVIAEAIADISSVYDIEINTNIVYLSTKEDLDVTNGTANTSGFTITKISGGTPFPRKYNFTDYLRPRDFVKDAIRDGDFLFIEVLNVTERVITLREPYTGSTKFDYLDYKHVLYVDDSTPVYVDIVAGKTHNNLPSGNLIDTHPRIAEDIIRSIGLGAYIDQSTFDSAHYRSPYLPSLCLPLEFDSSEAPEAKDILDIINNSCLGSIHLTDALQIGYDIFDGNIQNAIQIDEDDIISWQSSNDGFDIVGTTNCFYKFIDFSPITEESFSSSLKYEGFFAKNYVKSKLTQDKDYYLYYPQDAQEIIERDQMINTMSSSLVRIKGSMMFQNIPIGARVILNLRNFYVPYGSNKSTLRVGILSSKKATGSTVDVEIIDLGAIVLRTSKIVDDTDGSWNQTSEDERVGKGYIVNDVGIIDNEPYMYGVQLIS